MASFCLIAFVMAVIVFLLIKLRTMLLVITLRHHIKANRVIGVFHPNCNDRGGGEAVFFSVLESLLHIASTTCIIIYSKESNANKKAVFENAKNTFKIDLPPDRFHFVELPQKDLIKTGRFKFLSLLLESLSLAWVSLRAVMSTPCDTLIDTLGNSFINPLIRLFCNPKIITYIHYPIINSDMIDNVQKRQSQYNNNSSIATSKIKTAFKVLYYKLLQKLYSFSINRSDVILTNSTWTYDHIAKISKSNNTQLLYPPCDISTFEKAAISKNCRKAEAQWELVSIGQFRPEKNHMMQLNIVKALVAKKLKVKLTMIGATRNSEDEKILNELIKVAKQEDIESNVNFMVNCTRDEIVTKLENSHIGIHTMEFEHFGISIVELMASGCPVIAHNSAGAKCDIIKNNGECGYLANNLPEFISSIMQCMKNYDTLQKNAMTKAKEFTSQAFENNFSKIIHIFTN